MNLFHLQQKDCYFYGLFTIRRVEKSRDFQKTLVKCLAKISVSCAETEMVQKTMKTKEMRSKNGCFDKLLHQIFIKTSEFCRKILSFRLFLLYL